MARPRFTPADRLFLAAASRALPRRAWSSFLVTPRHCFAGTGSWWRCRWRRYSNRRRHAARRSSVTSKSWLCAWPERTHAGATSAFKASSRSSEQRSPPRRSRGYSVVTISALPHGEARRLGGSFLPSRRRASSAATPLRSRRCFLSRIYVLSFIELATRRVYIGGWSSNPNGPLVIQQARNLRIYPEDRLARGRFLIHDRDSKFTAIRRHLRGGGDRGNPHALPSAQSERGGGKVGQDGQAGVPRLAGHRLPPPP